MKISSVNIGNPQTINWRGKKLQTGIYKYPVNTSIYLGTEDVKNDHVIDRRYHGGVDKACYLFSEDHYTFWKTQYPNLDWNWGMFGENLTIKGLDEDQLMIGDVFKMGEAIVQITQPRQPCFKLGIKFGTQKMIKEFVESGHSGTYVRVIESGNVQKGDAFIPVEKATNSISIKEVFNLLYADKSFVEKAKAAIKIESLAEACKRDLMKHYAIL
ncbi:MAG: MOSC domain-containing protein [Chloroflexia bacterium]|nr:MOSC domain-containing protein [Chloroflexia bacterium]